jgi:hypothetical protein
MEKRAMYEVHTEIALKNGDDLAAVRLFTVSTEITFPLAQLPPICYNFLAVLPLQQGGGRAGVETVGKTISQPH